MALTFAVMVLATARLTRVVTSDTITDSLRTRIFMKWPPENHGRHRAHPIGQLIDCPWCSGWWIAGATVAVAAQYVNVPVPLIVWPAVAESAALLAHWLDR